jgi:hypothetical protein
LSDSAPSKKSVLGFHGWDETVSYLVSINFFLPGLFYYSRFFFPILLFFFLGQFFFNHVFLGPTPDPNFFLGTSYLALQPTYLPPFLLPTHLPPS